MLLEPVAIQDMCRIEYSSAFKTSVTRGGSRGGVEGVATPPLRIFFVILLDSS